MSLQNALSKWHEKAPACLDRFVSLVDPGWIDEALHARGTASLRRPRLPADQVLWLVIGLALFGKQPTWHIVHPLVLDQGATPRGPAPSVIVGARQRLGAAPLAWLINRLAHHWVQAAPASNACFHGLLPLVGDGVNISLVWHFLSFLHFKIC